jgi:hypothetical protein
MQTISRDDLERVTGGMTININLGDLLQQLMPAQGGAQPAQGPQQAAPQQQGGGNMTGNIGNLISMFSGMFGQAGGQGQGGAAGGGMSGGADMSGGGGMAGGAGMGG